MNVLHQPDKDKYFYGYRYVPRTDERGRQTFEMAPLTEEDALHPQLEDHVSDNEPHNDDCVYLKGACQVQLANQPNAAVFGNHSFHWDVEGMGNHSPDVAVVFGVRPGERSSFDVAAEGARPAVIIEVTSPATRNNDLNVKPREYWRCLVPCYVIVNELPRRRGRRLEIRGYERGPRRYRRMPLNPQGRLWLDALKMWLGQENGRAVCYDQQGQPIRTRVQAEQRAEQEAQARQLAEERAEQEAQARLLAEQRVEQEARARLLAEAEVARLRAQLLGRREEE
jgi:colicin import membrane protein